MVAVLPISTIANTGTKIKKKYRDVFRTQSYMNDGVWRYNAKRKVKTKHNTCQLTLFVPFMKPLRDIFY